ncbi:MAG: DUF2817 domain-containing protein [Bdellovibrionaceae bacterium]|nr:DUF2817 domain-containing protein [Bdellovibrionales bacterium]MCB9085930.1 DUF2817 domain-containing protein [Pseudobdellovibrionaceae bacterium]
MNSELLFSTNYGDARRSFVDFCLKRGGIVQSFLNPNAKGPTGEDLFTDLVRFGPIHPKKALFCISGTHGLECPAGRTAFINWLDQFDFKSLAPDTGLYFVHAINPYGFAHLSRTTENNVDLNRNFREFSGPLPKNPIYDDLRPLLCPDGLDELKMEVMTAKLEDKAKDITWQVLVDGFMKGQYKDPVGVMYGGHHREWSAETLETIVKKELGRCEDVLYIDWHTGLGEYGYDFYVCLHEVDSPRYQLVNNLLDGKLEQTAKGFIGGQIPRYEGLLLAQLDRWLAHCRRMGFVIEMGTKDNKSISNALMLDAWLRRNPNSDDETKRNIKAQLLEFFYPNDPPWQDSLLIRSRNLLNCMYKQLVTEGLPAVKQEE